MPPKRKTKKKAAKAEEVPETKEIFEPKPPLRNTRRARVSTEGLGLKMVMGIALYMVVAFGLRYFEAPIWADYAWAAQRLWFMTRIAKKYTAAWQRPGTPFLAKAFFNVIEMALVGAVAFTVTQSLQEFLILRGTTIYDQVQLVKQLVKEKIESNLPF